MIFRYGVLWDLDGVLVDTGELHFRSWVAVLPEYGLHMTQQLFWDTFGMNNAGVLSALLGHIPEPELVAEIGGRKEERFRQALRGQVQPLPGARLWLERLTAAGARQAIASSAPLANIEALVDELDLRPYFAALVSGHDLPGKPDPTLFLQVASLIGLPPERCLVVEDAPVGVQAARRAGMRCIAVTTTSPAAALSGADLIVERLDVLPADAFERLLKGSDEF